MGIPEGIMWMHVKNDRIYAADVRESFHVLKYRRSDNQLFVLSDDSVPRWITAGCVIDYHTVAGADKFDNLFLCRIPPEVKHDDGGDVSGLRLKADTAYLTGVTPKLDHEMQFHVGETVTSIEKNCLVPGGTEVLVYSTLLGSLGVMYPLPTRDDVEFFQQLEQMLRTERAPLCGREHQAFRSFYFPVKHCIDGDYCEQYYNLPSDKQKSIAQELDRTPAEVLKKLEDIKNRIL